MLALWLLLLAGAARQAPASGLDRCEVVKHSDWVWQLPSPLQEISGLALLPDGRVLAHDDERGRLLVLDPPARRIERFLPLAGEPHDDYEGIAIAGGKAYLLTSGAVLYRVELAGANGPLPYARRVTGLGDRCEFEGLAAEPGGRVLLLSCKSILKRAHNAGLRIYRWDLARDGLAEPAVIETPRSVLHRVTGWERLEASSIEMDPRTGNLIVLSARQHGLVEITPAGALLGFRRLDPKAHRQPEGLTFNAEGDLLISDEGDGGPPTLTRYHCRS